MAAWRFVGGLAAEANVTSRNEAKMLAKVLFMPADYTDGVHWKAVGQILLNAAKVYSRQAFNESVPSVPLW
jgi:hypothetical protein